MLDTQLFLEELRKSMSRLAEKFPAPFQAMWLEDAAQALGVSEDEMLRLIATGRILSGWVGGRRSISCSEVERLKALAE